MKITTREMILVALFPALMAATSLIAIPLPGLPSITLQTLFVFTAGLLLKKELSALSMIVYIVLGIIGVPVFANGTAGLAVLIGSTGGFIISFPLAAYAVSSVKNIKIINNEFWSKFVLLFAINLIIYMFGGAYFMYVTKATLVSSIAIFGVFIPGDILKILAAIYVYMNIRSHVMYEHS